MAVFLSIRIYLLHKWKYVHEVLVNRSVRLAQENVWLGEHDHWCVKPKTKCVHLWLTSYQQLWSYGVVGGGGVVKVLSNRQENPGGNFNTIKLPIWTLSGDAISLSVWIHHMDQEQCGLLISWSGSTLFFRRAYMPYLTLWDKISQNLAFWELIPIRFSNLTEFSDHLKTHFRKK